MTEATLDRILDDLNRLAPHELEQLSEALRARLDADDTQRRRRAFHSALIASGLVRRIKPPHRGSAGERRLVEVEGKPVSETIIEERR